VLGWRSKNPLVDCEVTDETGNLAQLLETLLPMRRGTPSRELYVPTRSTWTAMFSNYYPWPDLSNELNHARLHAGVRGVWITLARDTFGTTKPHGRPGATALVVYDGPDLFDCRQIALSRETSRWKFSLNGPPLPFEDLTAYDKPRKTDRFTPAMLRQYLAALGIDAFNPDWYAPDRIAKLFHNLTPTPKPFEQLTLEQAQANLRLDQ